jgi:hypothetical protein
MHNRITKGGHLCACILGCLAVLPFTAAQKVKVDFDHDADFSRVRHYTWRTHPVFEKNPELQQEYATGIQIVLQAGFEEMMKRGLLPDEHSPDVFITFLLSATDRESERAVVDMGQWWTTPYGWYSSPVWTTTETEYYKEGTLVIDIVDASTSKVLWRAYCSDTIRDFRTRDKNIRSAVRKAFEKFPPKT